MFPLKLRTRFTSGLVENIQQHFSKEADIKYPEDVVERSLTQWVEDRYDRILEEMGEVITSPHLAEARDFRRILDENYSQATGVSQTDGPMRAAAEQEANVFSGARLFSPEKLGAMIQYLTSSGHDIYKTNLNKLLFYADLTAYYLYGRGMSGATYLNRPFGPVPRGVESILDDLSDEGVVERIDVPEFGNTAQRITALSSPNPHMKADETAVLDWILDTYGGMSASELSELSHQEKAYKFTRPLEPIAYEYAKFFKNLPPKNDN